MAKKKKDLTPYQQARRQFVQQRVEQRGVEGTPEQRAQYRKRFDVLASTVQGRGKIAQQLGVEEPKAFRRMLATEMPSRSDLPTDTTGGGTQYKTPTAKEITAGWQQAVKSGSYKVPTPKTQTKITQTVVTPTSSKSTGNAWTNRRSNIIGKGIDYPGRQVFESITNPFGQKGPIKDWSAKGLAKVVGGELGEAAFAVPASRVAGGTMKAGAAVMKYGIKQLARFMPRLGQSDVNRFGGVGKEPYGPQVPAGGNKPMLELGPGPAPAPAPSSVSSAASAGKSTTPPKTNLRLNKKGGYGGKPYGPEVPAATPASATKSATTKVTATKGSTKTTTTKGSTTRATTTKKSDPDAPKLARPEAEDDAAYALAQMKNRFPGMTEKDVPFIQGLNRAQQAIEKKSSGWESYAKWMKNPQTVATLRRLRGK
jgi:hypothetical protein